MTNKHCVAEQILARGKNIIYVFLEYLQYFVALTIIVAIGITLLSIPHQLGLLTDVGSESLVEFLEYIINVIISIELIHVLLHQTLDSIVEVLSLAITRELILQHLHTYEFLIGVLAVAALFAIRKFLFITRKDTPHSGTEDRAIAIDEDGYDHKGMKVLAAIPSESESAAGNAPAEAVPTEPAPAPVEVAPSEAAPAIIEAAPTEPAPAPAASASAGDSASKAE